MTDNRSFDSTGRPIDVASRERGEKTLTEPSAQLSEAKQKGKNNSNNTSTVKHINRSEVGLSHPLFEVS